MNLMLRKYFLLIAAILFLIVSCGKDTEDVVNRGPNTSQTEDWMQDLIAKYPDRNFTLKDICIPRAHDAGMYELNTCTGGNACNTQTQDQTMRSMLEMGIRLFDVRPIPINGEYWTYHRTSCGGLGCEGALLRSFLEETKAFLDEHNELVIFEMNNLCNTSSQDAELVALMQDVLGNTLYKLNAPLDEDFILTPLNEIIPPSNSGGKVVLLFSDLNTSNDSPAQGLFAYDFIPISGSYANSPDIDYVIANQLQKFQNFNSVDNRLFKVSYTFTLDIANAVSCLSNPEFASSIEELSLEGRSRMSDVIDSWIANGFITKNKIPNIFSVDYCNTEVTMECIRLSELSLEL